MSWSPQQDAALKAVAEWLRRGDRPVFRLFGYAGTGKTTLARHIAEGVDGDVAFGAYTGKAALVMRSKGCEDASTIHSLIYRSREGDENGPQFVLNRSSSGRQGRPHRHRRVLDGRRGARARPSSFGRPSWSWATRRSSRP